MSIQFIWDDKYCVGNDVIDEQHKELFALGNAIPDVTNSQDIKKIVMQLFKYTREHFAYEEAMMKSSGFPLMDEHRTLHEDLITKLSDISAEQLETDDAIWDFKKFVHAWLVDHIVHEDGKFFTFLRSQH